MKIENPNTFQLTSISSDTAAEMMTAEGNIITRLIDLGSADIYSVITPDGNRQMLILSSAGMAAVLPVALI